MLLLLGGSHAGTDCLNHQLGFIGASNRDTNNTYLLRRVVVASWKQGVSYINHLVKLDTQDISKFPNAVGFIDARLGHIDRSRAAHAH